ncbi:MAG: universal stress protein [Vicinamibacterales bacterium]
MVSTALAFAASPLLTTPRRPPAAVASDPSGRCVLYTTDLGDPPPAAEAMLRQLACGGPLLVDVLHVAPNAAAAAAAEPRLLEVLADLPAIPMRRRIVVDTDAAAAVGRACASAGYHLVMAPATSSRWGRSLPAALTGACDMPLWTTGDAGSAARATAIRRVACEVTLERHRDRHLTFATQLADRLGARLTVVHVVPEIDDGTIADGLATRPLNPEVAAARVLDLLAGAAAEVVVGTGRRAATLRRLLLDTGADLLCVPAGDAAGPWWMAPHLRRAPCPVVCAGPHAHRAWASTYAFGTSLRMRPWGLSVTR